jgi:hypothetical protein
MIRLERLPAYRHSRDASDVDFLIETCQQAGYVVSPLDAEWAWGEYCEEVYAEGWLTPSEHHDVVCALLRYLHSTEATP